MKKDDVFASYLLSLGKEVHSLLERRGATKEDAEDIIQNTFYKVYTLLDDLTERNLRPWFFRVALNEFIDFKRKKNNKIRILQKLFIQNYKVQTKNLMLS